MFAKVYCWVLIFYFLAKAFTVSYYGGWFSFINKDMNQLSLILDAVFILGVFGYAFKKPILKPKLWLFFSIASALWYLLVPLAEIYELYAAGNIHVVNFTHLLYTFGPFLPLVGIPYFLYKYGHGSNGIWSSS